MVRKLKEKELLYITFINIESPPDSGSAVRPLKMLQAFKELGVQVKVISGQTNRIQERKLAVKEAMDYLKLHSPDFCYIEPPSGPMFYSGDLNLIRLLHRQNIPTGLFYRDAYWMFPEYSFETKLSLIKWLKFIVIRAMQKHQLKIFTKCITVMYFPSKTMSGFFKLKRKELLPPGCFLADTYCKKAFNNPLHYIFVGGAAINHGTVLTLEAFTMANRKEIIATLTYVCPKEQWKRLGINVQNYRPWLTLVHTSGDENLKILYDKADVAILTAPRTTYRDFAAPIKLMEYLSYLKPILVTNCTETARIISENHIGWVVEENSQSICDKLLELADNPDEIHEIKKGIESAREKNLWIHRAEKVIYDLDNTVSSTLSTE
ncbi:glycosyltransferase [bacterium D16-54]|nr:glycosyltransferase [bacterium D16-54]RKJ13391.1 glycosyltransferase [bacterium D16-56]